MDFAERTRRELRRAMALGGRAWMLTCTVSPQQRELMVGRAYAAAGAPAAWSEDEKFLAAAPVVKREFHLMVKRIRKQTGLQANEFRYMGIIEKHKDGFPHLHAVLIETGTDCKLQQRVIRGQWHMGHSMAKVIKGEPEDAGRVASYVAKYVTKEALTRLMCSTGWGTGHPPAYPVEASAVKALPAERSVSVSADAKTAVIARTYDPRVFSKDLKVTRITVVRNIEDTLSELVPQAPNTS